MSTEFYTGLDMTDSQFMSLVTDLVLEMQTLKNRNEEKIYNYIYTLNEIYNNHENYLNISNDSFRSMVIILRKFFIRDEFYYDDSCVPFYRQVLEALDCLTDSFKEEKLWELKAKEMTGTPSDETKTKFINYYIERPEQITRLYEVKSLLEVAIFMNDEPLLRKIRNTFFNKEGEFLNAI